MIIHFRNNVRKKKKKREEDEALKMYTIWFHSGNIETENRTADYR